MWVMVECASTLLRQSRGISVICVRVRRRDRGNLRQIRKGEYHAFLFFAFVYFVKVGIMFFCFLVFFLEIWKYKYLRILFLLLFFFFFCCLLDATFHAKKHLLVMPRKKTGGIDS